MQSLAVKWLLYLGLIASTGALAYAYPFLFELPLAALIGGAYWIFFRPPPAS